MTYYSAPVTPPKNKTEGLENFLQMIINSLEAGEEREALLKTVDLLEDVRCRIYKIVND